MFVKNNNSNIKGFEKSLLDNFAKIPFLSKYIHTRGWPYILAWWHRLSGIGLVVFLLVHIYTLNELFTPGIYEAKMKLLTLPFFLFLGWLLAAPVIFHALNGGRLILFENFGIRNDTFLIRCIIFLSIFYMSVMGLLMIMGNQSVSAVFFWLIVLAAGGVFASFLSSILRSRKHMIFWKLQRITAVMLIIMVPAHLLFTHLNLSMAHDSHVVTLRMHNWFIKIVDLILVLTILYHSGYGIFSITGDYLKAEISRTIVAGLIGLVMLFAAFFAVKLIILI